MALTELAAAKAYAQAWKTLDCSGFVSLLAPDAHYASQYVFDELENRDEIANYLSQKMETVKKEGSIVRAELAKATLSFPGKDCVALYQGNTDTIAAVVVFSVDGKQITRFDLCITQLYEPELTGETPD